VGLRAARADLIARLDANDVAHTDRLCKQVAFMKENRHVNVLGAQMQYINTRGRRIGGAPSRPVTQDGIRWHLLFLPPVNHPTSTYRRHAILEELNGYNEDFQVAQDAELWSRVAGKSGECSIANLREVLVDVRYDPKSISQNTRSPRRRGHVERMTTLLAGNAVRILGSGIPYEYANQWMSISAGTGDISAAYGLTFLSAIKILHETYCKQYPSGASNTEVNQLLKDVVFLTAYRLAESETMAARKAALHILFNELHRFGFADFGRRTLRILLLCAGLRRLRSLYRQIQQSR